MRIFGASIVVLALFVPTGSAQIMIPDSGGDRVMLFDGFDGSLLDANWLTDEGAVDWAFSTPKEAKFVGSELWVADQVEDAVHRFDAGLNFIGSVTGGDGMSLNNIRSLGFDGSTIYVTNADGDFDDAVVKFDASGGFVGFFSVDSTSIFDAEPFMGDLLISDSSNDTVDRYTTDGAFVSNFASGLGFAEQVVILADDSVIVADAIDSAGIEGLYHYNSDGSLRAYVDTAPIGGPTLRGGNILGNGNYILSTGSGIWTAEDDGSGGWIFDQVLADASGQYATYVPEPTTALLLGLAGLTLIRRR